MRELSDDEIAMVAGGIDGRRVWRFEGEPVTVATDPDAAIDDLKHSVASGFAAGLAAPGGLRVKGLAAGGGAVVGGIMGIWRFGSSYTRRLTPVVTISEL